MKRTERGRPAEFSEGAVWRRIVGQAVPLTAAQLVMLLYNIVDRIYLGHMSETGGLALTGCFRSRGGRATKNALAGSSAIHFRCS